MIRPMRVYELRDPAEARRYLVQGLWLQRAVAPHAETVALALAWMQELATGGEPLPPVGLVADIGHLALGLDTRAQAVAGRDALDVPGWTGRLARTYEDHVLGKLDADWTFARASDAVSRYQGRDRVRGLAFLVEQFRKRAALGGAHVNPTLIKGLLDRPAGEVLAEGWDELERLGLSPVLTALYDEVIAAVRNLAEVLGREDVFELEHRTALAAFGERIALRQVLQAADDFEAALARQWPRPPARRHDVPTHVLDEDTYPVGGFSSIATRGSIESLLHSQLAYMEQNQTERPDLFDIKFLRDELLYYARDENQFLRQRRTYVIALHPDLARTRVKDAGLPQQRLIRLLALLVAAVRKLTEWLSTDALCFEFLFLQSGAGDPLAPEQALLEMILREPIANGTVATARLPLDRLAAHCAARARRSLCHCLAVATTDPKFEADATRVTRLRLAGPRPEVGAGLDPLHVVESEDAPTSWQAALDWLLPLWV
jgi:hypothetical protein